VRNAFILLVVVALVILGVGAFNNGVVFNVDYVAGTANAVSLLWVSGLLALLVVVVGMAAAWFAQSATKGSRRKLEAELQSTYERLRETEALAARRATEVVAATAAAAAATEPVAATVVAEPESATLVATEDATKVAGEDTTIVSDAAAAANDEAVTELADEAVTEVAPGDAEKIAGADAPEGSGDAGEAPPAGPPASEAGEQTAITMAGGADGAGAAPAGAGPAPADAEAPASEPPADDTGAAGPASS